MYALAPKIEGTVKKTNAPALEIISTAGSGGPGAIIHDPPPTSVIGTPRARHG